MSFAQFSKNLKSGFSEGLQLTEAGLKKGATRQYNKALAQLEEYIAYDPLASPGGAVEGDPATPTSRDVLATRTALQEQVKEASNRMRKAGFMANDMEWREKADQMWAKTVSAGFSKHMSIAAAAIESGDNDAAERALNHAGGLLPSGGAYRFKRNEDGNFVMSGVDEVTGEIVEQKIVTPSDLRLLAASSGDPIKYLELLQSESSLYLKRREQFISEKNAAVTRAKDITAAVENLASAEESLSGTQVNQELAQNLRARNQENKNIDGLNRYIDKMSDDFDIGDTATLMKTIGSIKALANAVYIADGTPSNIADYAMESRNIMEAAIAGDREAISKVIRYAPGVAAKWGWSSGVEGIPTE